MKGHSHVRVTEERAVVQSAPLMALGSRLADTRLPPGLGPDWELGMPHDWLAALLEDWRSFDPHTLQRLLDSVQQLRINIDGQALHVIHAPGRGPDPLPLLLTHGWPGSFLEYLTLLPLLTDPALHGADPADAFTVIVPSLPGFGFSSLSRSSGLTARDTGRLWHAMMTAGLGYARYVAHGSDLGAGVTTWLARDDPEAVAAIHLATPGLALPGPPRTGPEKEFAAAVERWTAEEGGYAHQHATKPATLGAALSDSPAGMAAWIGEKVVAWSSTRPDGSPKFDRELLLSTLTLYWATDTITTSLLPYWAYRHSADAAVPADDQSPVATAVSIFGGERVPFPKPSRELAERYYTITSWSEHPVGGHFPAVAEPELLVSILRETFRPVR